MKIPSETRFLNPEGQLVQWPSKQTDQLLVISYLAGKFALGTRYSEAEVTELLKTWHTFSDWPLLRRELYNRGYVTRNSDGSNYRLTTITTAIPELVLVRPNVERDAPLSVVWMVGKEGNNTQRLMGNTEEHNKPTTLAEEEARIREFIISTVQENWELMYNNTVVGAVWLDVVPSEYLGAPSIHMMIGDPSVRGKGIGVAACTALIERIRAQKTEPILYSRHLTSNDPVMKLLTKLGFEDDGASYLDHDGLEFRNVRLTL